MKGTGLIWQAFILAFRTPRKRRSLKYCTGTMLAQLELSLATFKIKQMLSAPGEDFSSLELNLSISADLCIVWCCQIPAPTLLPSPSSSESHLKQVFFRKCCLPSDLRTSLKTSCIDPGIPGRELEGSSGREWALLTGRDLLVSVFSKVRRNKETELWEKVQ